MVVLFQGKGEKKVNYDTQHHTVYVKVKKIFSACHYLTMSIRLQSLDEPKNTLPSRNKHIVLQILKFHINYLVSVSVLVDLEATCS